MNMLFKNENFINKICTYKQKQTPHTLNVNHKNKKKMILIAKLNQQNHHI